MQRAHLHIVLCAVVASTARAQLAVTATEPAAFAFASASAPIRVSFASPLDPTTAIGQAFSVEGVYSGPVPGSLTLSADALHLTFTPSRPLFAGERVRVDLAATLRSTAGTTLLGGHHFQYWVGSAPGTRQFAPAQVIPLRRSGEGRLGTYGIFAGDVDGDGSPDITSMNEISNDIRVQHNSGCGEFASGIVIDNPGQWPSPNKGADFDRDGRIDLVTGNQNGGAISIYRNDAAGSFAAPVVYPTTGYVHGVAVGDFDGDCHPDVAAPNGAAVSVFRNRGDGTLLPMVAYDGGGTGEDNVSACDANEDGVLDLVVGNLFSNSMGVLLGQGDGTFQFVQTFPTGGQPFHQTCGDCNGDGHVDVLFANRGTNTFAVLFGNGSGGFSAPVTYPVGQTPAAIEVADLDGDFDLDVAVANYASADYSIWWNRGDGIYELPNLLAASQSGSCSTLVDFDRDGILDIIGADENADQAILYRQLGTGSSTSQPMSCTAALRIEQRGDRAGFGSTPPQPLRLGARVAIGTSGPDGLVEMIGMAPPWTPGYPLSTSGLLGLDVTMPPWLQVETLDSRGEHTLFLQVPPSLPTGIVIALQNVVFTATPILSNPQAVILVP